MEILAIFSGLISVEALAAQVVIVNVASFIFMVPLGISFAASAFTGVFLGRGKVNEAKKYSRLTLLFNLLVTVVILVIVWTCNNEISRFFTKDAKIVAIIDQVLVILMLYIFFDTLHGVLSGIVRGLGLQVWGSVYTLICYYLIGLPLALWLAFTKEMGVSGLWLGFSIATIVLDAGFVCIIECPSWHRIASEMQARIDKERVAKIQDSIRAGKRMPDNAYAGPVAASNEARSYVHDEAIKLTTEQRNGSIEQRKRDRGTGTAP